MKRKLVSLLILSSLSLAGCNLPVNEEVLSTTVAATLQAVDSDGEPKLPDATLDEGAEPVPDIATDTPDPNTPGVLTVAYINDGNIWFWQEGGSPVQLTASGNAVEVILSTDGELAVFIWLNQATNVHEVHAVDTASGSESVLLTQADLDGFAALDGALHHIPHQIGFLPGSHTFLLSTRKTFEGPGLVPNNDLWSINGESGVRLALLPPGQGGDFYLSPSGSMLALTQADSIAFANADGTGRSPDHLVFPPVITYSEYQYYPLAVWAPDDSGITVMIPPEDPFLSDTAQVYQLPVSGGSTLLTELIGFTYFRNQSLLPHISADLSKIAFMRETAPNTFDLVVQPLDGTAESVAASGNISWQGWNPDSVRMVYGDLPSNYLLTGPGLTPFGLGFGQHLRWVDADTYLYLDTLTATHRFSVTTLPGSPMEIDVIAGQSFDYAFTR